MRATAVRFFCGPPATKGELNERVRISIDRQQLSLLDDAGHLLSSYPVSTARKGVGELRGSHCTPRGHHLVRACIGAGLPEDTVFVARRPSGERYSPELAAAFPGRDWILARILWLSGCEKGLNRLGEVDTMRRYIYIHGSPDDDVTGIPASHGCIRMRCADIVDLFDRVRPYTPVDIAEA